MMRRLLSLLLTLLLALLITLPAALAEVAALPGPGGLFRSQGELLGTEKWDDGVTYQVYQYAFTRGEGVSLASIILYYQPRVEKAGYAVAEDKSKPVQDSLYTHTSWYALTGDGRTAYFRVHGNLLGTAGEGTLYVPEGMDVDPNPEGGSGSSSSFQNPIYVTDPMEGSSFQNPIYVTDSSFTFQNPTYVTDATFTFQNPSYADAMGDLPAAPSGPTVCQNCHGGKKCPTCLGDRKWRNPYTGDMIDCSCGNGLCSVCGGTGVWD